MSLDSLLTSLKCDVAAVADVSSYCRKGYSCNAMKIDAVADVAPTDGKIPSATSETSPEKMPLQREPLQRKAETSETFATAQKNKVEGETRRNLEIAFYSDGVPACGPGVIHRRSWKVDGEVRETPASCTLDDMRRWLPGHRIEPLFQVAAHQAAQVTT